MVFDQAGLRETLAETCLNLHMLLFVALLLHGVYHNYLVLFRKAVHILRLCLFKNGTDLLRFFPDRLALLFSELLHRFLEVKE